MPQMPRAGFSARAEVQLLVDMADVGVDGGVAKTHLISNFFVKVAFSQQVENFGFSRGQVVHVVGGWYGLLKRLDDLARDVAAHG